MLPFFFHLNAFNKLRISSELWQWLRISPFLMILIRDEKKLLNFLISSHNYISTLTCLIYVQQILLSFGKKTYTTLLGPTRLLILRWYSTYTFIQTYTIIKFWENFQPARFSGLATQSLAHYCKQPFKVLSILGINT